MNVNRVIAVVIVLFCSLCHVQPLSAQSCSPTAVSGTWSGQVNLGAFTINLTLSRDGTYAYSVGEGLDTFVKAAGRFTIVSDYTDRPSGGIRYSWSCTIAFTPTSEQVLVDRSELRPVRRRGVMADGGGEFRLNIRSDGLRLLAKTEPVDSALDWALRH